MTVTVRACAKVNLHLDILDRRDDGYHNLETVFQEIDLADQLVVSISDIDSDQLTVRNAPEVPADGRNLVLKAVAGLRKHLAGKLPFLSVGLTKHIPDGAGLGGGSSQYRQRLCILSARRNADRFRQGRAAFASSVLSRFPYSHRGSGLLCFHC